MLLYRFTEQTLPLVVHEACVYTDNNKASLTLQA